MSIRSIAIIAVVALLAGAGSASAQSPSDMASPAAEATVPPKAPFFPVPEKPDFTSMHFLIGTWQCTSHSERRGNEAFKSKTVYTMNPDGYFMQAVTTAAKVSYSATGSKTTDWYTYDARAHRWIDITLGSYGAYGYSTSTGWLKGHILWGADSFLPDGDVTSSTGSLLTKVSDKKYTGASAFTSSAGLLNRVSSTCVKT